MQKYIAVVNPKMDEDEISRLIRKGIAGALFEISHQNYPVAIRLINLIQELAKRFNKPISIIQDTSNMTDPLDMEVGFKSGVHWVATDKSEHVKLARGLNKLAHIIYKGRNLPKSARVDSIMDHNFIDPDASVSDGAEIRHLIFEHPKQALLDTLSSVASQAKASAVAVSDLDLARALSHRRPVHKTIFVHPNDRLASVAALYHGVHPVFGQGAADIKKSGIIRKGERLLDATNVEHVTIHKI